MGPCIFDSVSHFWGWGLGRALGLWGREKVHIGLTNPRSRHSGRIQMSTRYEEVWRGCAWNDRFAEESERDVRRSRYLFLSMHFPALLRCSSPSRSVSISWVYLYNLNPWMFFLSQDPFIRATYFPERHCLDHSYYLVVCPGFSSLPGLHSLKQLS